MQFPSPSRALLALSLALTGITSALAQNVPLDEHFVYQGELRDSGVVIDGVVDLQFKIFDQPAGGNQVGATQSASNVSVSRGVFQVDLPFTAFTFFGNKRHMEIAVRSPAGAGAFTTLNPRVELVPTPNAHFARIAAQAFTAGAIQDVPLAQLVQKAEAGSITLGMIALGAVDSAAIADGSITAADIAPNTITAAQIAAGTITGTEIASNTINSGDIQNGAVNSIDIADGTIAAVDIAPGAITANELAANSVDSSKIVDGSISALDLVPGLLGGGDATTLDGLDSAQFLRSDVNGILHAPLWTVITGNNPNTFTIGGSNLDLRLGDSIADTVTAMGSFTVAANASVKGDTTLGDAVTDETVVNGSLTVNGDLAQGVTLGLGTKLSLSATTAIDWADNGLQPGTSLNSVPIGTGPFSPFLRVSGGVYLDQGRLLAGGTEYGPNTLAGAYNRFGGWTPIGDVNPQAPSMNSADDLFITDDLEVAGTTYPLGGIRMGASEGDQSIFFYDNGVETASYIRWDNSLPYTCNPGLGTINQAFVWHMNETGQCAWVFEDGTDREAFIDETGNLVIDGVLTQSAGCDLAELFFSDGPIEAGTVVALDFGGTEAVAASRVSYQRGLVGVVSSHAGIVMSGPSQDALPLIRERESVERLLATDPENAALTRRFVDLEQAIDSWPRGDVPVALAGRVPVKVVGRVAAGDTLTSSDVPGHAMVMTKPGPSLGIAMESKSSEGAGTVLMLMQPGFADVASESLVRGAGVARAEVGDDALASLEQRLLDEIERRVDLRIDADARDDSPKQDRGDRRADDDLRGAEGRETDSPRTGGGAIVRLEKEAWGDFDADGRDDVLVVNPGGRSALYKNLGDGTFQDVTATSGLGHLNEVRLARFQDHDADQRLDLLLVDAAGKATLYQGRGDGTFNDISTAFGVDFGAPIVTADWIDHDHDGRMDLRVELADGTLLLHHNQGAGSFKAIELRAPVTGDGADAEATRVATLEAEVAELKAMMQAMIQKENGR